MPVEATIWTALSNFVHVHCEFFGQFRNLLRTNIWPSSIIIRYYYYYSSSMQVKHTISLNVHAKSTQVNI